MLNARDWFAKEKLRPLVSNPAGPKITIDVLDAPSLENCFQLSHFWVPVPMFKEAARDIEEIVGQFTSGDQIFGIPIAEMNVPLLVVRVVEYVVKGHDDHELQWGSALQRTVRFDRIPLVVVMTTISISTDQGPLAKWACCRRPESAGNASPCGEGVGRTFV